MTTSPSPDISPPSTLSHMDSFSVILASTPEGSPITSLGGHPFTQFSSNPISYLALIVERGINLCETRRSLEEGILKDLERREKFCLDTLESSRVQLAMTRRNAVDIAARLKAASGGIVSVTLPWLDGVESGAYDSEKKSRCPTPIAAPQVPIGSMAPPPPESITGALYSTLDTFSPTSKMVPDGWISAPQSVVSSPKPAPAGSFAAPTPSPTHPPAPVWSMGWNVSCQYDSASHSMETFS